MSSLKEWVLQLRYPYAAGVIVVIWIRGTDLFSVLRQDMSIEVLVGVSASTTVLVALTGFSSGKH